MAPRRVAASTRWPGWSPPARNRAIDRVRRERTLQDKTRLLEADRPAAGMDEIDLDDSTIPDERLELIFTCCHPALADRGAGGAHAARPRRAHHRGDRARLPGLRGDDEAPALASEGEDQGDAIPFAVPADRLLPERLAAVLAVVYLIFNQGYTDRGDLAAEAIRLGRLLAELMGDEPEVHGLLALMLLHDSRREARVVDGQLVPLAEQDRSRHDRAKVEAGRAALERALALRPAAGPYVLQAAIASLQAEEEIDWDEVAVLYERLEQLTGSPVVALNRAVAIAEAGAPRAGAGARRLARARRLPLPAFDSGRVAAPPGPPAKRRGRRSSTRCELAATDPERRFLARRLAGL